MVTSARLALIALGFVTLVAGVTSAILLSRDPALVNWAVTHWTFSYQYGFIKRGLPGEITSWLIAPSALFETVTIVSRASAIVVAISLTWVLLRPYRIYRELGLLLFGMVAVSHSGTISHFFYDIGRFDHYGLMLTLVCLAWIRAGHHPTAMVVGCGTLGILMHEAFVFIYLPLIVSYWLLKDESGSRRLRVALPVLAAVLVVVIIEGKPAIDQRGYESQLTETFGAWITSRVSGRPLR